MLFLKGGLLLNWKNGSEEQPSAGSNESKFRIGNYFCTMNVKYTADSIERRIQLW